MKPASWWRRMARGRVLAIALLALAIALAWHAGALQKFRGPDQVQALIDAWGAWAYVLYVATFVVLMPFGIPAFFWVLPAGILWPFWVAYPLSLLAVAGASSLGFVFARYIARDWVTARLPGRLRRIDAHFSAGGLWSVILFRIVFQLGAPTHWLLGLSKIDYPTFVLGTVLGAMPVVALVAWLGHDAMRWVEMHTVLAVAIVAALVGLVLVGRRWLPARARTRVRIP